MAIKKLHPKVLELKQRAAPVSYASVSVNQFGELETRASLLDSRVVEGYAVIWGSKNDYGEMFVKGAFAKSINERGPASNANYQIKFLNQHNTYDPLGTFDEIKEDEIGLYFRTKPLDEIDTADRLLRQISSGTINNFSIGWQYVWDKIEWNTDDDALMILEAELYEISPVTIPSDMETFAMRSGKSVESEMLDLNDDTEDFIKSIPRKQQLELRQLFARHKALHEIKPLEHRQKALEEVEPTTVQAKGLDYSYLKTNLKIF